MGLQLKRFDEIRDGMINRLIALSDKITDFNVGSVIRNIIVAVSAELDEVNYELENAFNQLIPSTADGENLENFAAGFGVSRSGAQKSVGMVVFNRDEGYESNVIIPAGTEVSTDPEPGELPVDFVTDDAIILLAGQTSCSGGVTASEYGQSGNVRKNTVTRIVSVLPLIDDVNNPYDFVGGVDEETDDDFRERFVDTLHEMSKGTVSAVEGAAKACPGIASAKLQENDPVAGYCKLYVATTGGTPSDAELTVVRDKIDGYVRPAGVTFSYYGAVRFGITVAATVVKEDKYNLLSIKDECELSIYNYILNKKMSENLLRAEIISTLMAVPGVVNVSSLVMNGVETDLSVSDVEVARPDSISVTVT